MGEVYAFCDPLTSEIRYVGMTKGTGVKRLSAHLQQARNGSRHHVHNWLRKLRTSPSVQVLARSDDRDVLANLERAYIAKFWQCGFRLTNIVDGGEGFRGVHTRESCLKMSISHTGRKHPGGAVATERNVMKRPEVRAKVSTARRGQGNPMWGRKHTLETRKKMSGRIPWNKGKPSLTKAVR